MTYRNRLGSSAQADMDHNKFALTHNGAVTLKSSTDPVTDLFFLIGASRGKDITAIYEAAYNADPNLTTRIALWARDCRGGAGERQLFRQYLLWLEKNHMWELENIINSGKVQELGRWDDLLIFQQTRYGDAAYNQISIGLSDEHTVGLVAKWMPRQGMIAGQLARFFGLSPRQWRKRVVASTNVVEQKMCARQWNEINFSHVPSVAASRYQKAFTKRAPEAYSAYRASLVKGEKGVKVNAATLYPYDVIKGDRFGDVTVSQAQWDALPDYLGDNVGILPIADVSGSMQTQVPGASMSMMDVSVSLALYIATKQKGDFHNVVMSFSSESDIVLLKGKTLSQLYQEVVGIHWGMSTDLNQAFRSLLDFSVRRNIAPSDMPGMILVISDMEFNSCGRIYTTMQAIEKAYRVYGYELPKIVFWNVNGRVGNIPVQHSKEGVALVSGFSPSIMKSVLSGTSFNPRDIMLNTVNVARYDISGEGSKDIRKVGPARKEQWR